MDFNKEEKENNLDNSLFLHDGHFFAKPVIYTAATIVATVLLYFSLIVLQ